MAIQQRTNFWGLRQAVHVASKSSTCRPRCCDTHCCEVSERHESSLSSIKRTLLHAIGKRKLHHQCRHPVSSPKPRRVFGMNENYSPWWLWQDESPDPEAIPSRCESGLFSPDHDIRDVPFGPEQAINTVNNMAWPTPFISDYEEAFPSNRCPLWTLCRAPQRREIYGCAELFEGAGAFRRHSSTVSNLLKTEIDACTHRGQSLCEDGSFDENLCFLTTPQQLNSISRATTNGDQRLSVQSFKEALLILSPVDLSSLNTEAMVMMPILEDCADDYQRLHSGPLQRLLCQFTDAKDARLSFPEGKQCQTQSL